MYFESDPHWQAAQQSWKMRMTGDRSLGNDYNSFQVTEDLDFGSSCA
jgi:hypothetical protein